MAFSNPQKWMVGSWNTGAIYIYSLGYFGLFSGVNSLAVRFRESGEEPPVTDTAGVFVSIAWWISTRPSGGQLQGFGGS